MDLTSHLLGRTVVDRLQLQQAAPVLTIGRDRFTRADLSGVACWNFVAALHLSRALADIGATSTKDVFDHVSPHQLAVPHVGVIALAVLGAAFQAKGLGGATPLDAWAQAHRDPTHPHRTAVTFSTIKGDADPDARGKSSRARQPGAASRWRIRKKRRPVTKD